LIDSRIAINLRLPESLIEQLDREARIRDRSRNQVAAELIHLAIATAHLARDFEDNPDRLP